MMDRLSILIILEDMIKLKLHIPVIDHYIKSESKVHLFLKFHRIQWDAWEIYVKLKNQHAFRRKASSYQHTSNEYSITWHFSPCFPPLGSRVVNGKIPFLLRAGIDFLHWDLPAFCQFYWGNYKI